MEDGAIVQHLKDRAVDRSRVYKFGDEVSTTEPKPFNEGDLKGSLNQNDPMAAQFAEKMTSLMEAREKRIRQHMAPPDSLGLPPVLEEARWKYGMVDACFEYAMTFDGVLLYQIPLRETVLSKGGMIVMPDTSAEQEQLTSTRAIIVDAGLLALDKLRSNGIDIGHKVLFTRLALYRPMVEMIDGKEERLVVVHDGDVRGSFTLKQELRAGKKKIVMTKNVEGFPIHKIMDEAGNVWSPEMPTNMGDYQP